jgi:hypothetical protein
MENKKNLNENKSNSDTDRYPWPESWRDNSEFDWLCEMDTCEDAIYSLRMHIQNCDRKHESRSIYNAEDLIVEIEDEIAAREEHPEWPTRDNIIKYCGIYVNSYFWRKSCTWKLTPDLLKRCWFSEDDFMNWLKIKGKSIVKMIEPFPEKEKDNCYNKQIVKRSVRKIEPNIGWDPYDLG